MTAHPIIEPAWAKINLSLRILGKREDGYHLLDSLVAFADIGDRIIAESAEEFSLSISGPFAQNLAGEEDNLVARAARYLARQSGVKPGVALRLEKNLPIASGIGGGSADAAATLRALCRLWKLPNDALPLSEIALILGADVPVCLSNKACHMTGIGDVLDPVTALPPVGILLLNPLKPCPTFRVFTSVDNRFSPPSPPFQSGSSAREFIERLCHERNDLTRAACQICPEIAVALDMLANLPGCRVARMSGSGATCFGLFDSLEAAQDAEPVIKGRNWWYASGRLLP